MASAELAVLCHWMRIFLLEQMPCCLLTPQRRSKLKNLRDAPLRWVSTKEPLGYSTLVAFKTLTVWMDNTEQIERCEVFTKLESARRFGRHKRQTLACSARFRWASPYCQCKCGFHPSSGHWKPNCPSHLALAWHSQYICVKHPLRPTKPDSPVSRSVGKYHERSIRELCHSFKWTAACSFQLNHRLDLASPPFSLQDSNCSGMESQISLSEHPSIPKSLAILSFNAWNHWQSWAASKLDFKYDLFQ